MGGGHLKMWFLTGKLIYLPPGYYPFPSGADTMPIYDVILFELHPSCPFPTMDGWVGGCWGKWQPHEERLARTCSRHWGDGHASTHKKPAMGICM